MPYIKSEDRKRLLKGEKASTVGELNYLITNAIIETIKEEGLSYTTIANIRSAIKEIEGGDTHAAEYSLTRKVWNLEVNWKELSCYRDLDAAVDLAFMEFYRRVVVPYENQKIRENGDVYPESIAPRIR